MGMSGALGLSESSRLTQKLQGASQDLVAAHGGMDLVCRHQEGNQHGDKEPTESSQALRGTRRERPELRANPPLSEAGKLGQSPLTLSSSRCRSQTFRSATPSFSPEAEPSTVDSSCAWDSRAVSCRTHVL